MTDPIRARREYAGYFKDYETAQVAEMHHKFGFTLNLSPTEVRPEVLHQRHKFLEEECHELFLAIQSGNFADQIDALIDLVVVAKGTAVMMGIQWEPHWAEVHQANMEKERGHNPSRPDQEEDLIKPEGWVGPDHTKVLSEYVPKI